MSFSSVMTLDTGRFFAAFASNVREDAMDNSMLKAIAGKASIAKTMQADCFILE
jgi:hypothetical protein